MNPHLKKLKYARAYGMSRSYIRLLQIAAVRDRRSLNPLQVQRLIGRYITRPTTPEIRDRFLEFVTR